MSYTTTRGITVIEGTDVVASEFLSGLQSMSTTTDDAIEALYTLLASPWEDYTPEWHASLVEPTLGNGVISGRYRQVGYTVDVVASVVFGSTSDGGEGYYSLSLPVAPRTAGGPEQRLAVDVRGVHINNPAPRWIGDVRLYSQSPDMTIYYDPDGTSDGRVRRLTATEPIDGGFGEADVITVWGRYEAAS